MLLGQSQPLLDSALGDGLQPPGGLFIPLLPHRTPHISAFGTESVDWKSLKQTFLLPPKLSPHYPSLPIIFSEYAFPSFYFAGIFIVILPLGESFSWLVLTNVVQSWPSRSFLPSFKFITLTYIAVGSNQMRSWAG